MGLKAHDCLDLSDTSTLIIVMIPNLTHGLLLVESSVLVPPVLQLADHNHTKYQHFSKHPETWKTNSANRKIAPTLWLVLMYTVINIGLIPVT
jgi:hypothetical protein